MHDQDDTLTKKLSGPFQMTSGGFNIARMIESVVTAAVVGALVVLGNAKVTESQVGDLREEFKMERIERVSMQKDQSNLSRELASIAVQMTAFNGQQVIINATTAERLTFMERSHVFDLQGKGK